ncbi:MAG: amino acid ABC transporter permease [Lachnospiraceae bacterium]|jgi:glutamine transport system permease protein|nr:amino acid ABC transporter permease [Lachnospiraceae bacterium]MCH4063714.1 amino acid ABC transporter permease [Lachnospiraceae bacterium]MCH4103563.1 amino acid ABC transporter permease [Lachnospiraceae bacterium]MCI1310187.1 amino acid ABC transporter permease [Lachnospiraceae bacterium]MCI1334622.1 amino acid ABC transporter permease [Lachnospiraceae bacterium]
MNAELFAAIGPMLLRGLQVTMRIAIIGILLGFLLGSLSGYALQSRNKVALTVANIYVWIIRGTPIVVQALYVYFVVPALISLAKGEQFTLDPNVAGILVITLNAGAFISAIVKGALESVDVGQKEAGMALGLTKRQILWHIVIPPAFRSMIPALFNQFIISVKDTAMLSIISVNEITRQTQNYVARTYNTIPAYTMCALFYLLILSVLMVLQKFVEGKIRK